MTDEVVVVRSFVNEDAMVHDDRDCNYVQRATNPRPPEDVPINRDAMAECPNCMGEKESPKDQTDYKRILEREDIRSFDEFWDAVGGDGADA